MNKKQKIITFTLLTWLFAANMTVFAEELPQISSPFDSPASGSGDNSGDDLPSLNKKDSSGEALPSLNKKDGSSDAPPSLNKKDGSSDAPPSLNKKDGSSEALPSLNKKDNSGAKDSDSSGVSSGGSSSADGGGVVSASKNNVGDAQYSDMIGEGDGVTADGATYVTPKPKKTAKTGPEAALLILPSLMLGYLYSRKRR